MPDVELQGLVVAQGPNSPLRSEPPRSMDFIYGRTMDPPGANRRQHGNANAY